MANLCHHCGACLHACQYAAPHEFDVNIPRAMARVRLATYTEFSWPRPLGILYKRNGLVTTMSVAFGLVLFLVLALLAEGTLLMRVEDGDFYQIFPHRMLVIMFGGAFGFSLVAMGIGVIRFWRGIADPPAAGSPLAPAALQAAGDALTLKNLGGGHGEGCNNSRRRLQPGAQAVPPPGLLRVHAVSGIYFGGHDLPLFPRPAGSLSGCQPAGAAWYRRRHGHAGGVRWAVVSQRQAPPRSRRHQPAPHGQGAHPAAVTDQPHRTGPVGSEGDERHAVAAGSAPRPGYGVLPDHAVQQICPWPLPGRGAAEVRAGVEAVDNRVEYALLARLWESWRRIGFKPWTGTGES